MNKRGRWGSMTERLGNGPRATEPDPPVLRHVYVTDRHGRLPGLLFGWRNIAGEWEGRVMHAVLEDGEWMLVEEWLPAGLLDQP
jgi:hypothetical protein